MLRRLGCVSLAASTLSASSSGETAIGTSRASDAEMSVRAFGARGDGITGDAAAIQKALDFSRHCVVPEGTYVIDRPLTLRPDTVVEFLGNARFVAAKPGMVVFTCQGLTPGVRIVSPRVSGGGKPSVTAFDLESFRNGCIIERPMVQDCDRGIVLRSLCWDLVIMQPTIIRTRLPITIADRSNAVDIFHPALDNYETGILIDGTSGDVASNRIWGGYAQNGRRGLLDRAAVGTLVFGTYFEGNSEADIALERSVHTTIDTTQHLAQTGRVGIRGRNTLGVAIRNPLMASGGRSVGLLDFDASNRDGMAQISSTSALAINRPLGISEGLARIASERAGAFEPRLIGSERAGTANVVGSARWRISGSEAVIDVDLSWHGHTGAGGTVVTGAPPLLAPASGPRPRSLAISEGFGRKGCLLAQLNGEGTNISLVEIDDAGRSRLLPLPVKGSLSFSLRYAVQA
jgi:hypothetical protein